MAFLNSFVCPYSCASERYAAMFSGLLFSSFTSTKTETSALTLKTDWEEYDKVNTFAWDHVCKPISEGLKRGASKNKADYFSRCPSGYTPEMTSKTDSVKTDKFVNGKVVFYKGCNPTYICDYKICVAKNFAMVRSKGTKDYMSVADWLKSKKESSKTLLVKK